MCCRFMLHYSTLRQHTPGVLRKVAWFMHAQMFSIATALPCLCLCACFFNWLKRKRLYTNLYEQSCPYLNATADLDLLHRTRHCDAPRFGRRSRSREGSMSSKREKYMYIYIERDIYKYIYVYLIKVTKHARLRRSWKKQGLLLRGRHRCSPHSCLFICLRRKS